MQKNRISDGCGNYFIDRDDLPCPYCESTEYDYLYHRGEEILGCDCCIDRADSMQDFWLRYGGAT